jgi:hypothetical protein
MRKRFTQSILAIAIAITAAVGVSLISPAVRPASGQAQGYRAPRWLKTNQPDLNGVWQALNSANYDIRPHAARAGMEIETSPGGEEVPAAPLIAMGAIAGIPGGLGIVEGGEIPYQPWAAERQRENFANAVKRDPEVKCFLPGVPRATYMPYPFQIVQTTSHILIAYEYANANRTVFMEKHQEAPVDSWMGWSNGHWEGETLVVDVTGFNEETWFDRAGNFHSDALHVVERYTPVSPNHLQYEATIEDAKVFTRPWKISMPLYRRMERNAQIMQYGCAAFVEELMSGHLRKEPWNRTWQEDLGRRGGVLTIEVTRGPSRLTE